MDAATLKADAVIGSLVAYAFDTYIAAPLSLEPAPDPRLAPDWVLRGYILGLDAVERSKPVELASMRVCYGFVVESTAQPGKFVAAIRGTANPIEWFENFEGFQVSTPWGGKAEAGFYGIYGSLVFRSPGGTDLPIITALSMLVGSGSLTVGGHSLGAALATMLAFQMAPAIGGRVALRVFASPHPGDQELMTAVATAVPDHRHWANVLDVVPKVPFGFSYAHLPNTIEIEPRSALIKIKFSPGCLHHIQCYLGLIDPDSLISMTCPVDQQNEACIVYLSARATQH